MRRWEESEPYNYDNSNYYNNNNTVGQSQSQFYGGQNGGRDWADARSTAGDSRGHNGGAVRRFDGVNNGGANSSGMWGGGQGGRGRGALPISRQSAAPSSVSSFGIPYDDSNPYIGGGGGGPSRGARGGPIDDDDNQGPPIVSAERFIGGHGFGDKYDTNQRALEQRRQTGQNGGRSVNRNQRGGGMGYDDGEELMCMAITDATFTNALDDTERPSERGRHNKMWRKARQQRKLENHILDTTAKYRDRTYGEGGAHSSDDEDHPRQNNQKGGGGAGVGVIGGRRVQIEEGNLPSDGDTTAAGEDDDDDDDDEEDEDAMSDGGASASDTRQLAKERRREEQRERKERKRTRKLTRLMLQEALGVKRETLKSLKKSQRYVADAEEAGQSAVKSLHSQSEQIGRIDNELDGLAPLMERAKRDINSIARRMFRDKCFIVLCLLVLVALIVVIALFARSSVLGLARTIGGVTPTVKPTLGPVANQTTRTAV